MGEEASGFVVKEFDGMECDQKEDVDLRALEHHDIGGSSSPTVNRNNSFYPQT